MTAEQTTRIEKMETELHEQRQIFIQGKTLTVRVRADSDSEIRGLQGHWKPLLWLYFRNERNTRAFIETKKGFSWILTTKSC